MFLHSASTDLFVSQLFLSVGGAHLFLSLSSTTGTETGVAEQVKGQPLEPAGGGRETFRRSVEAVRRGQAGSRETGAEW